jgi:hypothetical protein
MNHSIWAHMRYTKTYFVIREKTLETSRPKNYFASQICGWVSTWLLWTECIIHFITHPRALCICWKCPEISRTWIKYCIERLRRIANLNRSHIVVIETVFQIDFYLVLMARSRRLCKFSHLHRIRWTTVTQGNLSCHFLMRQVFIRDECERTYHVCVCYGWSSGLARWGGDLKTAYFLRL